MPLFTNRAGCGRAQTENLFGFVVVVMEEENRNQGSQEILAPGK